jgi:uncharacterized protein (TIGR04255 family)
MSNRPADLPEFENPPLHEVVIGLQFRAQRPLAATDAGLYWSRIRDEYPHLTEAPPLGPISEAPTPGMADDGLMRLSTLPPLRRCWFADRSGNRLLQLDSTRYLANWRKVTSEDVYPRFEGILDEFMRRWADFCAFCQANALGDPTATHGEVTYVNIIEKGPLWDSPAQWDRVLAFLGAVSDPTDAGELEQVEYAATSRIPGRDARLHVRAEPALRQEDMENVLRFALTATGRLDTQCDQWICFAREAVVRAFACFTTEDAHRVWRRTK